MTSAQEVIGLTTHSARLIFAEQAQIGSIDGAIRILEPSAYYIHVTHISLLICHSVIFII